MTARNAVVVAVTLGVLLACVRGKPQLSSSVSVLEDEGFSVIHWENNWTNGEEIWFQQVVAECPGQRPTKSCYSYALDVLAVQAVDRQVDGSARSLEVNGHFVRVIPPREFAGFGQYGSEWVALLGLEEADLNEIVVLEITG